MFIINIEAASKTDPMTVTNINKVTHTRSNTHLRLLNNKINLTNQRFGHSFLLLLTASSTLLSLTSMTAKTTATTQTVRYLIGLFIELVHSIVIPTVPKECCNDEDSKTRKHTDSNTNRTHCFLPCWSVMYGENKFLSTIAKIIISRVGEKVSVCCLSVCVVQFLSDNMHQQRTFQ